MKRLLVDVLIIVLLYVFFFSPDFQVIKGVSSGHILLIIAAVYAFLHTRQLSLFHKKFKTEFTIIILMIVYSVVRTALGVSPTYRYILSHCSTYLSPHL